MTKQEIIDLIKNNDIGQTMALNYVLSKYNMSNIADTLLAKIEQEKKATIKLILLGFQCALDEKQPERAVEETILRIAERYGVEL